MVEPGTGARGSARVAAMEEELMIILYLVAIILANLSVAHFGPSVAVVNAFLFIGLDLTARDALHERWHGRHLARLALSALRAGA